MYYSDYPIELVYCERQSLEEFVPEEELPKFVGDMHEVLLRYEMDTVNEDVERVFLLALFNDMAYLCTLIVMDARADRNCMYYLDAVMAKWPESYRGSSYSFLLRALVCCYLDMPPYCFQGLRRVRDEFSHLSNVQDFINMLNKYVHLPRIDFTAVTPSYRLPKVMASLSSSSQQQEAEAQQLAEKVRELNDLVGELKEQMAGETIPLSLVIDKVKEKAEFQGMREAYRFFEQMDSVLHDVKAWRQKSEELMVFLRERVRETRVASMSYKESPSAQQKLRELEESNMIFRTEWADGRGKVNLLEVYQFIRMNFYDHLQFKYDWYALRRFLDRYRLLRECNNVEFSDQMNHPAWFEDDRKACNANEMNNYSFLNDSHPEDWLDKERPLGSKASPRAIRRLYKLYQTLDMEKSDLLG